MEGSNDLHLVNYWHLCHRGLSLVSIVLLNFQGESSLSEATVYFFLYCSCHAASMLASISAGSIVESPSLIPVVSL